MTYRRQSDWRFTSMKKSRIRAVLFVSAFLMFLFLMDYPYLSRLYNDQIAGNVIAVLARNEIPEDCEKRLTRARAYNRFLAGECCIPGEDCIAGEGGITGVNDTAGENRTTAAASDSLHTGWMAAARVLCLEENNLAGWIRINALELILPLYIGTGEEALTKGAGILEGSSLPVGGEGTHTCISAHRGLPDRTLFTNLDMLKNGDRIEVHTLGRTIDYQICGEETVLPTDTKPLAILPGRDLLTLITCTPYGINTHRLYVHAKRCPPDSAEDTGETTVRSWIRKLTDPVFWKLWWWIPATVFLLFFMILVVRAVSGTPKNH